MHLDQSQFYDLIDAIEEVGGKHLEDSKGDLLMCTQRKVKVGSKELTIPGCGNYSLFEIPYDSVVEHTNATVLSSIQVCALCDDVGWWPRFVKQAMGKTIRDAQKDE